MTVQTLADYLIKRHRLSWFTATTILRQIIVALEEQNAIGTRYSVLDASSIQIENDRVSSINLIIVNKDTIALVRYLAPEIIRGQDATAKTVTWSLAVLLFQMISGVTPFAADDLALLKYQILYEAPALVPPEGELPGGLSPILSQAFSKNPALRPDPGEFVASALQLKAESGVAPKGRRSGFGWPVWVSLVSVISVLAIIGFLLAPRLLNGQSRSESIAASVASTAASVPTATHTIEPTPTADPLLEAEFVVAETSDGVGLQVGNESPEPTLTPLAQSQEIKVEATPTLALITPTPTATATPSPAPTATSIPTATRPLPPPLSSGLFDCSRPPMAQKGPVRSRLPGNQVSHWKPISPGKWSSGKQGQIQLPQVSALRALDQRHALM